MKTSNIFKVCILFQLAVGIFYLIKVEDNLDKLNSKISKFNFYTQSELKSIREIKEKSKKDSLLGAQTIIKINGSVDAYIENTVDVNVNN